MCTRNGAVRQGNGNRCSSLQVNVARAGQTQPPRLWEASLITENTVPRRFAVASIRSLTLGTTNTQRVRAGTGQTWSRRGVRREVGHQSAHTSRGWGLQQGKLWRAKGVNPARIPLWCCWTEGSMDATETHYHLLMYKVVSWIWMQDVSTFTPAVEICNTLKGRFFK